MYRSALLLLWPESDGATAAAAAALALTVLPVGAAVAARPRTGVRHPQQQHVREAPRAASPSVACSSTRRRSRRSPTPTAAPAPPGRPATPQSVEYVVDTLEAAGWEVELDTFDFTFVPPPKLNQTAPITAEYETGVFTGTGYGIVSAAVTPVDIVTALPRDPVTSGCEDADFANFPAGNIALIQRGTCEFGVKAINAQEAGASAVIIFNQGNTELRSGLVTGTLFGVNQTPLSIPVVGASYADGAALAQAGSQAAHPGRLPGVAPAGQRHRRAPGPQRLQRRHGRCAPRLRAGRAGHQRQRQRIVRPARDRPADRASSSRSTPSASRGGVPRRAACSARAPTWPA